MSTRHGTLPTAALLLAGCADPAETEPAEQSSGSSLCLADHERCVAPMLDALLPSRTATCSSSGCHSLQVGSGRAFKIYPGARPGSAEMLANFCAAGAFANLDRPADSKLLLEPLAGSASITGTHTGGDIFPNTGNACYQAALLWIRQRVEASDASSCGSCSAPSLASCGYH